MAAGDGSGFDAAGNDEREVAREARPRSRQKAMRVAAITTMPKPTSRLPPYFNVLPGS
jgi:hypothetical protein